MDVSLYTIEDKMLSKINEGLLYGLNGELIPSFKSLNGLINYRIDKFKYHLRSKFDINDLIQQSYVLYSYCVNRSQKIIMEKFTAYFSTCLDTELLRYIARKDSLIKVSSIKDKLSVISFEDKSPYCFENYYKEMTDYEFEERTINKTIINEVIDTLEIETKIIICKSFGLKNYKVRTLEQICEDLNLSLYTVRKKKNEAIKYMKNKIGD